MMNALRRVPISGLKNKNFLIKGVSSASPLSFSSKSLSLNISKQPTFLLINKRFYSTQNNNNSNNNKLNEVDLSITDTTATPNVDLSTPISAANQTLEVISNKVVPSYILTPTMGPDANRISEFFHQLNFDMIAVLNDIHTQYGLPWIAIIACTAISVRLLTLPVSVKNQKDGSKMKLVKEEMEKHSYLNDGTQQGRVKVMEFQQKLFTKYKTSPMRALALNMAQMPFLLYPFVFLRQLCNDTTLLNEAGFFWFKNLSMVDPFFILPIISSIFQYGSVRLSMQDDASPIVKYLMTGLCFVPLIFTVNFAAGLNVYWAINSMIFAATNWFLKSKRGSKLFNIPYTPKTSNAKKAIQVAPETFTSVKNTENTNTNKSNNTTSFVDELKKQEQRKLIQEKQDLLEKRNQEYKSFGRRK
ncbi:hypothetical protein RB653_005859 [Dictyostelium firmibasis]|uniref:Membrane insertase YidC/Oxa/ALB C-terminal domain-containing protein n=1 Tax=Dictyostelium firmibasis TaxID=79012 RepID=A0AAN7YYJ5_9MYCE